MIAPLDIPTDTRTELDLVDANLADVDLQLERARARLVEATQRVGDLELARNDWLAIRARLAEG